MIQQAFELHGKGDLAAAARQCREILDAEPDNADALHLLGVIHRQNGDWRQAIQFLERSIEIKPDEGMFHNSLGHAWQSGNEPDKAIACYRDAIRLNPNIAEAQNNLACSLLQQGDVPGAQEQWELALRVQADHVDTMVNLGNLLCQTQHAERAREILLRAVELEPDNAEAQTALAWAFLETESPAFALQCLKNAIRLSPHMERAHLLLARTHQAMKEPELAFQVLQQCLQQNPHSPLAQADLGDFHAAQGDFGRALASYQRSLEALPTQADVLEKLARMAMRTGQFGRAVQAMQTLVENFPDNVQWHMRYGEALGRSGNLSAACTAIATAMELDPAQSAAACALLADLHQCAGELSAADEWAQRAMGADPEFPAALLVAASMALRQGKPERADALCNQVVDSAKAVAAEKARANYLKARAADQGKDYEQAVALLSSRKAGTGADEDALAPVLDMLRRRGEQIPEAGFPAWPDAYDDALDAPVFLFGAPGSGANALAVALAGHPALGVLTDRCFGGTHRSDFITQANTLSDLHALDEAAVAAGRRDYWAQIRGCLGNRDTLPTCIDLIPYEQANPEILRRYFPQSVIIEVRREVDDLLLHGYFSGFAHGSPPQRQRALLEAFMAFHTLAFQRLQLRREVVNGDDLMDDPSAAIQAVLTAIGVDWHAAVGERFARAMVDNYGLAAYFPRGHASHYQFWLAGSSQG